MKIDQVFIIALFTKMGNKNITIILNELAAHSRLNKTIFFFIGIQTVNTGI